MSVDNGNDSTAENMYSATHFTVSKTGEIVSTPDQPDLKNRVIKWTVMVNPTCMKVEPDNEDVMFTDILPDGLTLINYDAWNTNKQIDTDQGQIYVGYSGNKISGTGASLAVTTSVVDGHIQINSVQINPAENPYGGVAPTKLNE